MDTEVFVSMKKLCKSKVDAFPHIFQSFPVGQIWIFPRMILAPEPYIWHPSSRYTVKEALKQILWHWYAFLLSEMTHLGSFRYLNTSNE